MDHTMNRQQYYMQLVQNVTFNVVLIASWSDKDLNSSHKINTLHQEDTWLHW